MEQVLEFGYIVGDKGEGFMMTDKRYFNGYFWRILLRFMLIPLLLFLVIVPATIEAKNLIRTSLVQTAENDLKANSQSVDSDLLRLVQQAQTMGKNINVTGANQANQRGV